MKNITPDNIYSYIDEVTPLKHRKPIHHLVTEIGQFAILLERYADDFTARGLSSGFLACASLIAKELEQREKTWAVKRYASSEAKECWRKAYREALAMRQSLIADMELAFYGSKSALNALGQITAGSGTEDLLMDIGALHALAINHADEVNGAGISSAQIENIAKAAKEYIRLFNEAEVAPDEAYFAKLSRDKARTVAEKYCSLVRYYVDRMYRKDPKIRKLFVSKYQSDANRRAYKRKYENSEDSFIVHE